MPQAFLTLDDEARFREKRAKVCTFSHISEKFVAHTTYEAKVASLQFTIYIFQFADCKREHKSRKL